MDKDLSVILSLRRVLETVAEGRGVSQSTVRELRNQEEGAEVARLALTGLPPSKSYASLMSSKSEEAAMLASLIVGAPMSSASLVGLRGSSLSGTFERWAKLRENARLEWKVVRFRGLVTSGVLGGVMAMIAAIGPLVGALDFASGMPTGPSSLPTAAAAMTVVSSSMLGIFMSGRGFLVNVAVSLAFFVAAYSLASPLASSGANPVWGIK
jgi:hypothetical protein